MDRIIGDEQWWTYHQKGYLRLGRLLSDQELASLQKRIDDIMMGKVQYEGMMMQLDLGGGYDNTAPQTVGFKGPTLEYRKIEQLEMDPLFLNYMQKPIFREICDYHYGAHADISSYRSMFMNKPANKGTILPWHQDGGENWGLDRDPLATAWTALDPATIANGCVQVIPGTHKLGLVSKWGHTLSDDDVAKYCPDDKIEYMELGPGEAVLLHNWLIHRSDVNQTDLPRRGLSVNYVDARATHIASGKGYPMIFGENALRVEELQTA